MPKHSREADDPEAGPASKRPAKAVSADDVIVLDDDQPDQPSTEPLPPLEEYEITDTMKQEMAKEVAELVPVVADEVVVAGEEEDEECSGYDHDLLQVGDEVEETENAEVDDVQTADANAQNGAAVPEGMDVDTNPDVVTPLTNAADANADAAASLPRSPRIFFQPRMWPEGKLNDRLLNEAIKKAAMEGGRLECQETGVWVDKERKDRKVGAESVWSQMRRDDANLMPVWRELNPAGCQAVQHDASDFLKACMRLGRLVDPEKLSVMLGGGRRDSEYCRFLLAAFLGIVNVGKARLLARDLAIELGDEKPVGGDGDESGSTRNVGGAEQDGEGDEGSNFSSDDDSQNEGQVSGDAQRGNMKHLMTRILSWKPKEDEDGVDDEPTMAKVERLIFENKEDELFANTPSYTMRNYFMNMSGGQADGLVSYIKYCLRIGLAVDKDSKVGLSKEMYKYRFKEGPHRVKWASEPMPAPELGPDGALKGGTLEMWRHATKYFSSRTLARCALIQYDRLLDWLGYVSNEAPGSQTEDRAYYKDRLPVVSIAPIPMLYLADLAAEFALKVLSVAVHLAQAEPTEDEPDGKLHVVTDDEVVYAAGLVMGQRERHRVAYHMFGEPPLSTTGTPIPDPWPHLRRRPITESESIVLCDRLPSRKISVPVNVLNEVQATVMSFGNWSKRHLYTQHRMFQAKIFPPKPQLRNSGNNQEVETGHKDQESRVGISETANGKTEPTEDDPAWSPEEDAPEVGIAENRDATNDAANVGEIEDQQSGGDNDFGRTTVQGAIPHDEDELFRQVNVAAVVAAQIAKEQKPLRHDSREVQGEWESASVGKDLGQYLNDSKNLMLQPCLSVCYHRLGWICLYALGQDVESGNLDANHLLGYGSTANYTNFGDLGRADKVTMAKSALGALAAVVDQLVRREAEVLMACAAHDDGRPWIDRADVVLVHSVRKEEYRYGNVHAPPRGVVR